MMGSCISVRCHSMSVYCTCYMCGVCCRVHICGDVLGMISIMTSFTQLRILFHDASGTLVSSTYLWSHVSSAGAVYAERSMCSGFVAQLLAEHKQQGGKDPRVLHRDKLLKQGVPLRVQKHSAKKPCNSGFGEFKAKQEAQRQAEGGQLCKMSYYKWLKDLAEEWRVLPQAEKDSTSHPAKEITAFMWELYISVLLGKRRLGCCRLPERRTCHDLIAPCRICTPAKRN